MKKQELIDAVAKRSGLSKATVRDALDATATVVALELAQGGEVFIFGLGKLFVRERAARPARHMVTGDPVMVPRRLVAAFSPSTSLAEACNVRALRGD